VIRDSSDAVMLSAESAAGKYPLESVTMQQLVINKVESDEVFRKSLDRFAAEYEAHRLSARNTITSAITLAARQVRCLEMCGTSGCVVVCCTPLCKHRCVVCLGLV
jgi:pyruvate kinase